MTWQAGLIAGCLILTAFGFGCWIGERKKRPTKSADNWPRFDASVQRQFERMWRVR